MCIRDRAENAQGLQVAADRLAAMVSERVQIPVRAFVSLDYTAEVEAMRSGQVHFGWLLPAFSVPEPDAAVALAIGGRI